MSRAAVTVPLALLALTGAAGTSSAAPTREPDLVVPADMTVEALAPIGANVSFTASATGRENQSLPVACSPKSGSSFPLGQTTVACTAQDRPDEIVTRSFMITLLDRTAPRLVVPASVKARTANRKGAVVRFRVSATDLVDAAIVPVCSPASSTLFRVGVTRVDCTATDRGQNVARASFTVSVTLVRKARQVGLFSPAAGEVVSTAPPAGLATRAEGHVLQRPAFPRRSPDPERLAEPAAAPTTRRVDAPRTTNAVEPGKVRLVRLAGLRRSCARPVRRAARPQHVSGPIKKPPQPRGLFENNSAATYSPGRLPSEYHRRWRA